MIETSKHSFECAARKQGTAGGNDPVDCNWPICGCDPYADKVIAALQEIGALRDEDGICHGCWADDQQECICKTGLGGQVEKRT